MFRPLTKTAWFPALSAASHPSVSSAAAAAPVTVASAAHYPPPVSATWVVVPAAWVAASR